MGCVGLRAVGWAGAVGGCRPATCPVPSADKSYWTHGYVLISQEVEDCVPAFLKHIAHDVYVCGKTINLLKLCCPQVRTGPRLQLLGAEVWLEQGFGGLREVRGPHSGPPCHSSPGAACPLSQWAGWCERGWLCSGVGASASITWPRPGWIDGQPLRGAG